MPRTRKQPKPTAKPVALNGPTTGEVLTLAEAAAYLRLPEEEVVKLTQMQDLPGRLAGRGMAVPEDCHSNMAEYTTAEGKQGGLAGLGRLMQGGSRS